MNASTQIWLWVSAAVSLMAGFLLLMNDSSAGWFLIIMGIIDIGASTPAGRAWATTNPTLAKWGLVAATALLLLLVLIVGAVLLFELKFAWP